MLPLLWLLVALAFLFVIWRSTKLFRLNPERKNRAVLHRAAPSNPIGALETDNSALAAPVQLLTEQLCTENELSVDGPCREFLQELSTIDEDEEDCSSSVPAANLPNVVSAKGYKLICYRNPQWSFGLLESQGMALGGFETIEQNSLLLKRLNSIWCVPDLFSPMKANTNSKDTVSIDLGLIKASAIIFKMQTGGNVGKLASAATDGEYLVLAPKEWTRATDIAGAPTTEPESTNDPALIAHHFSLNKTCPPIAFKNSDGNLVLLSSTQTYFHLVGHSLSDSNEEGNTLFGKDFPRVIFADKAVLESDCTISMVQIGTGKRLLFFPLISAAPINLTTLIKESKSGVYKIELADKNGAPLQSIVFRLCLGLESIVSLDAALAENVNLDSNRIIEITHSEHSKIGLDIEAKNRFEVLNLQGSSFIVDKVPKPLNRLKLNYTDDTTIGAIPICVTWDKLWWQLDESRSSSLELSWSDSLLEVPAKLTKASSEAVIRVKLPTTRWCSRMHVSVGKKNKRIYRPLVKDEILRIKLRDFCDSPELETPGSYPITVECDLAGRRLKYAIGHLQVNCACKLCGNQSRNTDEALDHIAKAHRSELFGPITEARRTELLSELPAAIYHCRYCDMDLIFKYIDDTAYGADKHLKDACHGAPQTERDLPMLVKSRAALEKELTETQACCVCTEEFYGSDLSAMAAHYAHHHKAKALRLIQ